jgi:hypothetical protein
MKASLKQESLKGKAHLCGLIKEYIQENGLKIVWKGMGRWYSKMGRCSLASSKIIKSTGRGKLNSQTVRYL